MAYTKIATAKPFSGKPKINIASVFGASPEKPFLLRIPVTGQRPISYGAKNLPDDLTLEDNIITGTVSAEGEYEITLTAENALCKVEKKVTLEIKPWNMLVTPLLGFTTWNAFGSDVTQADVENTAQKLVDLGIEHIGKLSDRYPSAFTVRYFSKGFKHFTTTIHWHTEHNQNCYIGHKKQALGQNRATSKKVPKFPKKFLTFLKVWI